MIGLDHLIKKRYYFLFVYKEMMVIKNFAIIYQITRLLIFYEIPKWVDIFYDELLLQIMMIQNMNIIVVKYKC